MKKKLGVYVHIPFCKKKCYYCDFISYVNKEELYDGYVDRLIEEIESFDYKNYEIESIFIGGGTPTVLKPTKINKIIEAITKNKYKKDIEITIECNPNTLTKKYLEGLKKTKINRLSIGLQSTENKILNKIGRIHTYEEFLKNYSNARELGFNNINIDLMFALPEQTVKTLENTLNKIISLNPEHISLYSLIVEEKTKFYEMYTEGKLKKIDEDTDREMYELSNEILKKSSYNKYEISNYSKKGFECNHNVGYWILRKYVGFGVSSHSFLENKRSENTKSLKEYLTKKEKTIKNEVVTKKDMMEEFMFLGLRLTKGIKKEEFEDLFKTSIESIYKDVIIKLEKEKLLEVDKKYIRLTPKGVDLSNIVLSDFLL